MSETAELRNIVMCAVLLNEWLKELAAITQEQAVADIGIGLHEFWWSLVWGHLVSSLAYIDALKKSYSSIFFCFFKVDNMIEPCICFYLTWQSNTGLAMSSFLEIMRLWLVSCVKSFYQFLCICSVCRSEIAFNQSTEPNLQIIQVFMFPYLFFILQTQADWYVSHTK